MFGLGKKKTNGVKESEPLTSPENVDIPNLPSDFSADTLGDLPEFPEQTNSEANKFDDLEPIASEDKAPWLDEESETPDIPISKEGKKEDADFTGNFFDELEKEESKITGQDKNTETSPILPKQEDEHEEILESFESEKNPLPQEMHEELHPFEQKDMTFSQEKQKKQPIVVKKTSNAYYLGSETFAEATRLLSELQIGTRKIKNTVHWRELTEKEAKLLDTLEDTANAAQKKLIATDLLLTKR